MSRMSAAQAMERPLLDQVLPPSVLNEQALLAVVQEVTQLKALMKEMVQEQDTRYKNLVAHVNATESRVAEEGVDLHQDLANLMIRVVAMARVFAEGAPEFTQQWQTAMDALVAESSEAARKLLEEDPHAKHG